MASGNGGHLIPNVLILRYSLGITMHDIVSCVCLASVNGKPSFIVINNDHINVITRLCDVVTIT